MLTAHKIKILQSLDKKKFRQKYNLFLVEGNKTITELRSSVFKITELYTINDNCSEISNCDAIKISPAELKKISFLQHPKDSVAVCEIFEFEELPDCKFNLILDGIQDPGNLGTIIRLADWFGIEQIVCSEDTVDFYNPKVIQASMGSFTRVNVIYKNIEEFIKNSQNVAMGTDMNGENIYQTNFPERINLILGNEGNGIRPNIEAILEKTVTIPRFGKNKSTESLNVSMAAGIILGEIFSAK